MIPITKNYVFLFAFGLSVFSILSNCKRSLDSAPTREECTEAHLHSIELLVKTDQVPPQAKQLMLQRLMQKDTATALVKSCTQTKTFGDVRCELSQTDFSKLDSCYQ